MRLIDGTGKPVDLDRLLGRGGEGEVYSVAGQPGVVAKILYPKGRTTKKFDKLRSMVARPPSGAYDHVDGFPVLTWPRGLLFDRSGRRPVGYTMARVQERDFVPFYKVTAAGRRRDLGGPTLAWDRLVLLGIRLCHVVRTLHRLDYAVGDMNDRNVLVSRRFTPLFMDTDSFQVPRPGGGHFSCVVGDQMYWPPEHLDVDYAAYRGSRVAGDLYALGVLLFQLFLNGHRPYQARGSRVDALESLVDKTRAGHYPWKSPRRGVLEPPAGAPHYENLPSPIRALFERCFVRGHRDPRRRPTAEEWYKVLLRVHNAGFQTCPRHAGHVFGRGERECPWCKDPNNPFGLPAGRRPPPRRLPPRRRAPAPKPVPPAPTQTPVAVLHRKAAPAKPSATPARAKRQVPHASAAPRATARAKARSAAVATPGKAPSVRRPLLRWAWVSAVLLLYATPLFVLPAIPMVAAKQVVLFALTTVWIGAAALVATWRWIPRRRTVPVAMSYVALGAVVAATAALTIGWTWLDYANAAIALALGGATFVYLERRQRQAFWPRPRGVLNASLGATASYLPVAAVWLSTRL